MTEVAWIHSSYSSESANCVETAPVDGEVWVRDSKLGEASPSLSFGSDAWAGFVAAVKAGDFDRHAA